MKECKCLGMGGFGVVIDLCDFLSVIDGSNITIHRNVS